MSKLQFRCVVCGKLTAGRLPRTGRHTGDGTYHYPRRHKGKDGKPCPGNIKEAEWIIDGKNEGIWKRYGEW